MTDLAIRVENLSKRYRIGQREPYLALRDVLTRSLTASLCRLAQRAKGAVQSQRGTSKGPYLPSALCSLPSADHIWALRDVITKPTKGHAEVHGRVGSLVEVGTGFHPAFTL